MMPGSLNRHNTQMRKTKLKRYLPSPQDVRTNKALRPVEHLLARSEIWHLNRRSAAGAVFIGLFCAFIPLPMQMIMAASLAVATRCNLPIAVGLVWVSNPITIAPLFYFTYQLGAWLLNLQISQPNIAVSFGWLWENLATIGYPLLVGSLLCGWVAGVSGFVLTRVLWRLQTIKRWRERRARGRTNEKSSSQGD